MELTCAERVAFHQYTFPENKAQVLVDLQHGLQFIFDESNKNGLVLESDVKIENNTTISGYCSTQNWVNRKYFFTIIFDQPFLTSSIIKPKENEKAPKYLLDFILSKKHQLKVKIALSTVSVEGSKLNMEKEIPHWDFKKVYQLNLIAWNKYLNKISIEAKNYSEQSIYTNTCTLNGIKINKPSITYQNIMNGGYLVFEMLNKLPFK